ncbi:hypothetical protein SB775_17095 [Peribacillus sp. SIMBA_075]|uniref:hypothetical protein n=1 Tax=Peribacillus sp. SIMBA_075 TaxID=3085813 RepID=UPI00397B1941
MEQKEILINVIKSFSNYYEKQKSFKKVFLNEPVMSKAIEVFDAEMNEMLDHVFDLIGIPNEESSDKYDRLNWTRNVCTGKGVFESLTGHLLNKDQRVQNLVK